MFAKTVCKPGSYLSVVPAGLLVTLQYNARGSLEKVLEGYGDSTSELSSDFFLSIAHLDSVPNRIKVTGGTTWVEGVIYSKTRFPKPGVLPMVVSQPIQLDIKKDATSYTFYAGNVRSLAAPFGSYLAVSNWIKMAGFRTLPSYLVFAGVSDAGFNDMLNDAKSPFEYPIFSGFFIFEGSECRYHRLNLRQDVVTATADFVDDSGYFRSTILLESGTSLNVHLSQKLSYGLCKGTIIVTDPALHLIHSNSKSSDMHVTCPVCGNSFLSKDSGPVSCSDPDCPSHLVDWFSQFCFTLDLPKIDSHKLMEAIQEKHVTCFSDILLLTEYANVSCEVDLFTFVRGIVPVSICSKDALISKLCALCGNNIQTFYYYLSNPSRLSIELGNSDGPVDASTLRLIEWISNPYIICTITTLLDSDQFILSSGGKLFDGAPIFRGKSLAITGTFRRGSIKDIMSILKSYKADVTVGLTSSSDCLIVGDLNENNDGRSIQQANASNILIYTEDAFFTQFDIDTDVAAHFESSLS